MTRTVIYVCDACNDPILTSGLPLANDGEMISAALEMGRFDSEDWPPDARHYHRGCARTVTLSQVWDRLGRTSL